MDESEKRAAQFLKYIGYSNIEYEPREGQTPDFLVDGTIAVEVRRLNQNDFTKSKVVGLEHMQHVYIDGLKRICNEMGPPTNNESWSIGFTFSRPAPQWQNLRDNLKAALAAFQASSQKQPGTIFTYNRFKLEVLYKSSKQHKNMFLTPVPLDLDDGGWVYAELIKNIPYCVEEKTKKIEGVRSDYPYWWLILIDRIGYALSKEEHDEFRDYLALEHSWDRITLLNPLDHTHWLDL